MINEKMSEMTPTSGAMLHIMQRHKDILKDYNLEFKKTQNNFTARKDRDDLLSSVRKDIKYVWKYSIFLQINVHILSIEDIFSK